VEGAGLESLAPFLAAVSDLAAGLYDNTGGEAYRTWFRKQIPLGKKEMRWRK